eukprot:5087863-Pyramimonas_sp.AAC.1
MHATRLGQLDSSAPRFGQPLALLDPRAHPPETLRPSRMTNPMAASEVQSKTPNRSNEEPSRAGFNHTNNAPNVLANN